MPSSLVTVRGYQDSANVASADRLSSVADARSLLSGVSSGATSAADKLKDDRQNEARIQYQATSFYKLSHVALAFWVKTDYGTCVSRMQSGCWKVRTKTRWIRCGGIPLLTASRWIPNQALKSRRCPGVQAGTVVPPTLPAVLRLSWENHG